MEARLASGGIDMEERRTWREVLGKILSDTQVRQRVANELGVRTITLMRWINNKTDPRLQNLRRLLNALPEQRDMLAALITEDIEDFSLAADDDIADEIPSIFYARALSAHSSTPPALRSWSISNLILGQAIKQLDPDRLGIAILVLRCMPPSGQGKILSLRGEVGVGTHPWSNDLESKSLLFGAESLAGYAAASCRPAIEPNIGEGLGIYPVRRMKYERSAAAYPIMRAASVAGSFAVSSTQPNFFQSQSRQVLVQAYADLMLLAFEPEEFYDPRDIQLCVMPPPEIQSPYFASFRHRVAKVMRQAALDGQPMNPLRAELLVWQQLEAELMRLSAAIVDAVE
jgi:hypothetical protein